MSSFLGTISYLYPVLFLNLLRQKALYKNIETNSNQNLKFRCLDFFSIYIILLNDRLGPKISLLKCVGGYKGYDGLFSKCVDKCATLFTYPY